MAEPNHGIPKAGCWQNGGGRNVYRDFVGVVRIAKVGNTDTVVSSRKSWNDCYETRGLIRIRRAGPDQEERRRCHAVGLPSPNHSISALISTRPMGSAQQQISPRSNLALDLYHCGMRLGHVWRGVATQQTGPKQYEEKNQPRQPDCVAPAPGRPLLGQSCHSQRFQEASLPAGRSSIGVSHSAIYSSR